jgi:hypothetical protein
MDNHKATPKQWEEVGAFVSATRDCILELRARVEALEGQGNHNVSNVTRDRDKTGSYVIVHNTATPPPKPPTVMEILDLSGEIEDAGLGQIDLVRAALERWGHG